MASSDDVLFYLNSHLLAYAGATDFPVTPLRTTEGLTPAGPVTNVPESSRVLTVIFSAVYGSPCDSATPLLDDILEALDRMPPNGMDPKALVRRDTPLYEFITRHYSPYHPLRVYAAAAHYGIESLAQDTSSHLLNFDIGTMDDASAVMMGPLYLKRLFMFIDGRIVTLKRILIDPPAPHPLVRGCSEDIQRAAKREWADAIAQLTRGVKSGAFKSRPSSAVERKLTSRLSLAKAFQRTISKSAAVCQYKSFHVKLAGRVGTPVWTILSCNGLQSRSVQVQVLSQPKLPSETDLFKTQITI